MKKMKQNDLKLDNDGRLQMLYVVMRCWLFLDRSLGLSPACAGVAKKVAEFHTKLDIF